MKIHFIFIQLKNERLTKIFRLSGATFYDCIFTIYQFIKPFFDEICPFLSNIVPLII